MEFEIINFINKNAIDYIVIIVSIILILSVSRNKVYNFVVVSVAILLMILSVYFSFATILTKVISTIYAIMTVMIFCV